MSGLSERATGAEPWPGARGAADGPPERTASPEPRPSGRGAVSGLPEHAAGQPARLTGRGAVATMAGLFLIGLLLAAWLGWAVVAGLAFVAGCVLAARYAATAALLTVVVSPPLLFLAAVILVSAMTGPGGLFMSVVVGSVVTLASVAPWLVVGMVLTVIITWIRGLPGCIKDLRQELRSAGPSGDGQKLKPPAATTVRGVPGARPPG